jgi:hypothetical protein
MVVARQCKSGNGWGPPVLGDSKTTSREDEDGATCSWVAIVTWKREKTMGCSAAPFKLKQGGEMGGWGGGSGSGHMVGEGRGHGDVTEAVEDWQPVAHRSGGGRQQSGGTSRGAERERETNGMGPT